MADEMKLVKAFVARRIAVILNDGNEAAARAALANLRRGHEAFGLSGLYAALFRVFEHGFSQRMLTAVLKRRRHLENLRFGGSRRAAHISYLRRAGGQRSRFIEYHCVHAVRPLQRLG